jgi:CheY-like chemotaxis protein
MGKSQKVIRIAPGYKIFKILIVEDNYENRTFLSLLLQQVGFEVRDAVNGREGIRIAREWHPDFIWMDIRMPEMDGIEATRILKSNPETASIFVCALTASAFEEDRKKIVDVGFDDFIRKPFLEDELFTVMARLLGISFLSEMDEVSEENGEFLLNSSTFQQIDSSLLDNLYNAVIKLDREEIEEITTQIKIQDEIIGEKLQTLADNLEFDRIIAVLEEFRMGRGTGNEQS